MTLPTPYTPPAPGRQVRFRDFTADNNPEPITFRLAPDDFQAFGAISTPVLQELANALKAIAFDDGEDNALQNVAGKIEAVLGVFDLFLTAADGPRFRARVMDRANPVDFKVLLNITQWIMEQYTGRPTEPSSNSSDGSPTDDGSPSSTGNGSPEESTPSP